MNGLSQDRHQKPVHLNSETLTASRCKLRALRSPAGVTVSDMDYIICSTMGGRYQFPSLASCVAEQMGATARL
jgi:3-oxoacyl-[acyl-carrier-protein] synthase III